MIFTILRQAGERPDLLPFLALTVLVVIVLAFSLHELGHAATAYWLGDDTAARAGRLSINPFVQIDPVGFLLLLFVGFGWAKPVLVQPWRLRPNPRVGNILVSGAGPAMNVLQAFIYALPLRFDLINDVAVSRISYTDPASLLAYVCVVGVSMNILLAVFNMLPIPPLDGFHILVSVVPQDLSLQLQRYQQYGMGIFFGLIVLGQFTRIDLLGSVMGPASTALSRLVYGV